MNKTLSRRLFEGEVTAITKAIADGFPWVLHSAVSPRLDLSFAAPRRRTLRIQLNCLLWDAHPPYISLYEADGTPMKRLKGLPLPFNPNLLARTGRPFVCMPGSRDYHEHPQHQTGHWERYRGQSSFTLGGIVHQLWTSWSTGTR